MESACNASADNPSDGKPRIIKCNDYCLIAERNKRVALALDIEETASAPGPRIPDYDSYVLDYASANMEFTLKIEKQLGEWVADISKPILYFPAMKGHRRKFVHELAANYNVTSESVDVEPYRSVTIRRLPDTSIPDLLASQACRQKRPVTTSSASSTVEQLRKPMIKDPVNAIYLHDLVFGLTRSELAAQLAPVFGNIKYGIRWLTDDDAVLVPHPGSMQMDELEIVLVRLRSGIKTIAAKGNLCERVELCWINQEGEVVSHTNVGSGSQTRRFFSASQGNQGVRKMPPKIENAFALLDDDERIAAAKRAEEERILRAREAAGTLSIDAWEEASTFSPAAVDSHPIQPLASKVSGKFVAKSTELTDEVVDDWQELLDDDEAVVEGDDDSKDGATSSEQERNPDKNAATSAIPDQQQSTLMASARVLKDEEQNQEDNEQEEF
ncbi:hypothetical protein BGZ65_012460 [Modicella reniformis]|uniref:R3H domain-containing protein n=1 Tax=Modicella reniformis TaxID=1440133 RepID=A0A9P6MBN4_9FUNG|nr:hypothetical protein BGZ65_012460 [Modicella reniformis]